jgi:hypothetical protein
MAVRRSVARPALGAGLFAPSLVLLLAGHPGLAILVGVPVVIPALLLYRMFHEALAAGRAFTAWCPWLTVDLPPATDDLDEGR